MILSKLGKLRRVLKLTRDCLGHYHTGDAGERVHREAADLLSLCGRAGRPQVPAHADVGGPQQAAHGGHVSVQRPGRCHEPRAV